jgi:hypothetical protein
MITYQVKKEQAEAILDKTIKEIIKPDLDLNSSKGQALLKLYNTVFNAVYNNLKK